MKVLILFTSSELGGAERSLTKMARAATYSTPNVEYFIGALDGDGAWSEWAHGIGMTPFLFGKRQRGHGRFGMLAIFNAIRFVRERNIDIVYVIGFRSAVLFRMLRWCMPCVKLVQGIRWNPDSTSRLDVWFRRIEKYAHRMIDGYVTNSTAAYRTLQQLGIPSSKLATAYNGLDAIPSSLDVTAKPSLVVITVANLNYRKGYEPYLHAISKVVNVVPDVKFIFLGRDDLGGVIQSKIQSMDLTKWVTYAGFQQDVSPFLKASSLMVLPSLYCEGCPTSIMEAMSFGLPIVAYAIDGIPELVESGKEGLLVDQVGNVDFLADSIVAVLENTELRERLSVAARSKAETTFSITNCCKSHEQYWNRLIYRATQLAAYNGK
ncbi:glycosyltransferase family 4 protein [Hahella aquimaris]|uniref:glycosyltransferase family 4 protein n=1 Tax=Hahella sp. HNIBRBA332 TaxID=3015983 RepID=UPI00273C5325|nr:glycosyltransferase family 4 protein [Hahella sp. HNIBRBA332]WLQ15461.1 glycosyltransferase family 4 protein [Hahella sp. HNIBRBA332]